MNLMSLLRTQVVIAFLLLAACNKDDEKSTPAANGTPFPSIKCDNASLGDQETRVAYKSAAPAPTEACEGQVQFRTCKSNGWSEWSVKPESTPKFTALTCQSRAGRPCSYNSLTIPHGGIATQRIYTTNHVPFGETCNPIDQTATCTDGTLGAFKPAFGIGSYYTQCTELPGKSCGTVDHGGQRKAWAYKYKKVSFAAICKESGIEYTQTCNNGTWDGAPVSTSSYPYATCSSESIPGLKVISLSGMTDIGKIQPAEIKDAYGKRVKDALYFTAFDSKAPVFPNRSLSKPYNLYRYDFDTGKVSDPLFQSNKNYLLRVVDLRNGKPSDAIDDGKSYVHLERLHKTASGYGVSAGIYALDQSQSNLEEIFNSPIHSNENIIWPAMISPAVGFGDVIYYSKNEALFSSSESGFGTYFYRSGSESQKVSMSPPSATLLSDDTRVEQDGTIAIQSCNDRKFGTDKESENKLCEINSKTAKASILIPNLKERELLQKGWVDTVIGKLGNRILIRLSGLIASKEHPSATYYYLYDPSTKITENVTADFNQYEFHRYAGDRLVGISVDSKATSYQVWIISGSKSKRLVAKLPYLGPSQRTVQGNYLIGVYSGLNGKRLFHILNLLTGRNSVLVSESTESFPQYGEFYTRVKFYKNKLYMLMNNIGIKGQAPKSNVLVEWTEPSASPSPSPDL